MITTLLSLALAAFTITPQAAVDEVPAGHVTVDIVSVNGSGCPVGTTEIAVADDNSEFTVTHHGDFTARVGPGVDPTDSRKNCQLALSVNVPSGFTFGIIRADYRGDVSLRDGAVALQRALYYFQGMSDTTSRSHPFRGPIVSDWHTTDATDPGSVIFAPCGQDRLFNINTELRVNAGTSGATSSISMDSPDRNPNAHYRFVWKRC
ncbi:DUF4360 domain-containing protein [Actinocrispum wychmicini]|uniref:Uncharacterized protein DUF4360 n=1 Tax=Actinocrispum wychmicini TaxID=1213861 RepID=A0A4V2S5W4_9PSEU|nr:DUF4360 domain-containing protein [Actinocrispum wychmicini]TCO53740.1 uncharacterized protein DUF4360 [Actinocrispum wychmicini]